MENRNYKNNSGNKKNYKGNGRADDRRRDSFREEHGWQKAKDTAEGRKRSPAALSINMI